MIDTSLARHWFMHTPHAAVGLAAAAKVRASQPPPPATTPLQPASPQETRTLRVGLIAGPEATWDLAAARVAEHLRKDRSLEVYHAWDCVELGIDDPTDYDCLVLLGWPAASSRRADQADRTLLPRRRIAGRAAGNARGNPRLVELRRRSAGRAATGRPAMPFAGSRAIGDCLASSRGRGRGTMIAEGEVYSGPRFSPDITVLLTALRRPTRAAGGLDHATRRRPRLLHDARPGR